MTPARFEILAICTGNVARSPLMVALLADGLRSALGPDAEAIAISSAGTRAVVGADMAPEARRAAARLRVEAGPHRGRQLTAELVASADLVVTADRGHRREAVELQPPASARAFTLLEFAELVREADRPATGDVIERLGAITASAHRRRGLVPLDPASTDLADPYGRGARRFRETAGLIAEASDTISHRLAALLR
jgi:protein-tyrosine phosphatase